MNGQDIKNTLGKNIKFYRFRKDYSQADLAEKADISITFLSNIERGLKFPKPDIMSRIAESLDINVSDLFINDIESDNCKKQILNFSEDITKKVNQTLNDVYKQYLG